MKDMIHGSIFEARAPARCAHTRVAVTSTLRVKRRPRPGAWIVIRPNAECNSSRVNYILHFRISKQVLDFRDVLPELV